MRFGMVSIVETLCATFGIIHFHSMCVCVSPDFLIIFERFSLVFASFVLQIGSRRSHMPHIDMRRDLFFLLYRLSLAIHPLSTFACHSFVILDYKIRLSSMFERDCMIFDVI